ncbi:MAG: long-chain fatty acid--CoA ligase [Myxococcales bacterium]|nr:long-chain fatty acid--CoA ligase [Myxococcales bacterium]
MFVADWLSKRAHLSPEKVALIDQPTGEHITYKTWDQRVQKLALSLQRSFGVKKGDRVAILAMNCVEYLDVFFACGRLGAILQNLNWRLQVRELDALLKETAPLVLVYGEDFLDTVQTLQKERAEIPSWIAFTQSARAEDAAFADRDAMDANEDLEPVEIFEDDPWLICYTGGTTGLPKGATLTHGNILANAINTVISWELDAKDVAILNAPLFHVGGLNVFTTPLVYAGGTSIVCKGFDVGMVFDLVQDQGVTVFFGVPTMFIMMQEAPRWKDADFSKTKFVISGGAPCPLPVFERFWEKGVHFKTGYGLTEAGPNNFWLPKEDIQRKPGAVGFPLMHVQIKVVHEDGKPVGPEEVGELCLRGPHVMKGYWQRPDASAAVLRDGWLHTGDLVRVDEEGYVSIVGRLKDMYISGGENVYPAEIESVLHEMDGIAEAALVGVPDARWGEVGLALLRREEGASIDDQDVLRYCHEHLARYKIPRFVVFAEEIPKTSAGKIDKKAIVARFEDDLPAPSKLS